MNTQSEIDALLASIVSERIGNEFGEWKNYRSYYRILFEHLSDLDAPSADLETTVLKDLAEIHTKRDDRLGSLRNIGYVQLPSGKFAYRGMDAGDPAFYWTGRKAIVKPYPGITKDWSEDYSMFAGRVVDLLSAAGQRDACVIDLGGGTGAIIFHIEAEARRRGMRNLRYVNIEREPEALAFSKKVSARYGVSVDHVFMDVAASLKRPEDLKALKQRIGESDVKILVTHSALRPFYTTEQYRLLFDYFVQEVGASAGAHWELNGFKTETYKSAVQLPEPPPLKDHFVSCKSDPFEFLPENVKGLSLEITVRLEIWPHFPNQHFPSYLSWRKI